MAVEVRGRPDTPGGRGLTGRLYLASALLVYGLLGWLDYLAAARGGVQVGLLYEYLLAAAALVFFARYVRHRSEGHAAVLTGSRRDARAAVLTGLGLFAAIMVLRLHLYGTTGQIWGKAPMLVLTLAAALGYEGWGWDDLGLHARRLGSQVALGVLACLWMWVLITASFLLADLVFVGSFRVGWAEPEVAGLAVVGLSLRFLQGNFAEELFFRGYLLRRWGKALGPLGSLWGQALLFGLFHVNYHLFPVQPLPLLGYVLFSGGFGLAMGIITQRTGSLVPASMAHPFYNLAIACGLASPATTWMADPWAPVAVVRAATYLIQMALFWWVLPRLMDWSLRVVAATPRAAGTPYPPSAARNPRDALPPGASPAT